MKSPVWRVGLSLLSALFLAAFAAAQQPPAETGAGAAAAPLLLLQTPTLSRTQIAFAYGGDIWIVARSGGAAHRLATG
ncbi:MAG: hypothetical protein ACRD01_03250, partial [Terriglobales bacterium]